jgi:catechol-2,3-dioxygenase
MARSNVRAEIALRDHPETPGQSFNPCRIGLDHVALQVPNRDELEAWHVSLVAEGVTCSAIEPSPFGLHVNKDPDGIAIELFTPST